VNLSRTSKESSELEASRRKATERQRRAPGVVSSYERAWMDSYLKAKGKEGGRPRLKQGWGGPRASRDFRAGTPPINGATRRRDVSTRKKEIGGRWVIREGERKTGKARPRKPAVGNSLRQITIASRGRYLDHLIDLCAAGNVRTERIRDKKLARTRKQRKS